LQTETYKFANRKRCSTSTCCGGCSSHRFSRTKAVIPGRPQVRRTFRIDRYEFQRPWARRLPLYSSMAREPPFLYRLWTCAGRKRTKRTRNAVTCRNVRDPENKHAAHLYTQTPSLTKLSTRTAVRLRRTSGPPGSPRGSICAPQSAGLFFLVGRKKKMKGRDTR
jgi:hypothetical protein